MFQYRITKYDPTFRIDGKYTKEEWTSVSDIGKIFNGKVFTQEEYKIAEQKHIDCLLALLALSDVNTMHIEKLECCEGNTWQENQEVDRDHLHEIIRDCLREKCWCILRHKDAFIHFGYDYYTYIGTNAECGQCDEICQKYGLFCEEIISPYKDPTPEIYCAIVLNFDKIIGEEPPFIDDIKAMDINGAKFWVPKHRRGSKLTIAEIYYEPYWDLEDALTHLFQMIDGKLPAIKEISKKFNGKILLDIAFYQYGTYPSLVFDGENMEKIRFLEADISIDPYGPFDDDDEPTADGMVQSVDDSPIE